MSTSSAFDPNQKRDQAGRWDQQRGTRPTAGSLPTSPAKAQGSAEPDAPADPAHWRRYTPEQRQRLRDLRPLGWDELGSSGKDMWEERTLAAFARAQERSQRTGAE